MRSAFGLPAYVAAPQAAPFSTALRSARNDKNARLAWKRVLRAQEPDEDDNPDLHA